MNGQSNKLKVEKLPEILEQNSSVQINDQDSKLNKKEQVTQDIL